MATSTPRKATAKKAPAKKVAATRRTAPPRAKPEPTGPKRWDWDAYGQTWSVKRPNVVIASEIEDAETAGAFINYLVAHVDADQRDAFFEALTGDEDLDITGLMDMIAELQEVVYADIPTPPSAAS